MFNPEHPPELAVASWVNTEQPLSLKALTGKVVVICAFHSDCDGSLKHALPQAARIATSFERDSVEIIGLHMAFDGRPELSTAKLTAFAKTHDLTFPIGRDKPAKGTDSQPETMTAYELQGTPTVLLFDRQGRLRRHYLGQVDDFRLGAEIMALAIEAPDAPREASIAIERRLHATLSDPDAHDHTDACGCGHEHSHEHHGHEHGHDHDHGHDHHGHDHRAPSRDTEAATRQAVADAVKAQLRAKL